MKNRHVGYLIIGIAFIFLMIVISFNNALETIVNSTCSHGSACPMHVTLKFQETISYGLIGLLIVIGLLVSFFMKDEYATILRKEDLKDSTSEKKRKEKIGSLKDHEKIIMDLIIRENGSVYQSDIIKHTKLSKVKVTRILDKLEGMQLIERKRRGMTNIIILK